MSPCANSRYLGFCARVTRHVDNKAFVLVLAHFPCLLGPHSPETIECIRESHVQDDFGLTHHQQAVPHPPSGVVGRPCHLARCVFGAQRPGVRMDVLCLLFVSWFFSRASSCRDRSGLFCRRSRRVPIWMLSLHMHFAKSMTSNQGHTSNGGETISGSCATILSPLASRPYY